MNLEKYKIIKKFNNFKISQYRKAIIILLVLLIFIIGLSSVGEFFVVRSVFKSNINHGLNNTFNLWLNKVDALTDDMTRNGTDVAFAGESYHYLSRYLTKAEFDQQIKKYLFQKVENLPSIFGSGIWYEAKAAPYKQKFYGSYVFRKQDEIVFTWEYSNEQYDYFLKNWYSVATKAKTRQAYFSPPYKDSIAGKDVVFFTLTVPMFDKNGHFIGVSSTDWVTDVIIHNLKDFYYTKNSFILLFDDLSQKIIYDKDPNKIMMDVSQLPIGQVTKKLSYIQGIVNITDHVKINNKEYLVMSSKTKAGFNFIMAIPPAEAYSKIIPLMLVFVLVAFFIIIISVWVMGKLFSYFFVDRITNINSGIQKVQNGNYDFKIDVSGGDELASIGENINLMADTILKREKQLMQVQLYWYNIVESMPSVLISINSKYIVTQWNEAAEKIFRIKKDDAFGKDVWELLPYFEAYKKTVVDAIKLNKPTILNKQAFRSENSVNEYFYNITIYPLTANNDSGAVIHLNDITEIVNKENQLLQAQKMEAVGTLAGGLAHDFNNVLSGIMGTTSLMLFYLNNEKEIKSQKFINLLNIIDKSANRASSIVKQLLMLSKRTDLEMTSIDLNKIIKDVINVCANTFEKSVTVEVDYAKLPAMVKGNPTQLEQIFVNLCINAYHSMTIMREDQDEKPGGKLTVKINSVKDEYNSAIDSSKSYWCVEVKDTGVGISPENLQKILDPFFSTKSNSDGTGLGLTMVDNIVKNHDGILDIKSELGQGSIFSVYLEKLDLQFLDSRDETTKISMGNGTILVVDDEQQILDLTEEVLQLCGYNVFSAINGDDGLTLYQNKFSEIDLVILDLDMPLMAGDEVFTKMRQINPQIKVVLSSGFLEDPRVQKMMDSGVKYFLQKPYSINKLSDIVKKALNSEK